MADNPINLGDLKDDPRYSIKVEPTEEVAARLREEAAHAKHKRTERFVVLCFALVMVALIFLGCFYEYATGSTDDKKWSGAIIVGICGSFVGYVVRSRD